MQSIPHSYNNEQPKRKSSFGRIHRTHKSSTRVNQVELQGEAYLCFAEDFSSFQGNISTNDESNYSIFGELILTNPLKMMKIPDSIPCTPQESDDEESDAQSEGKESESSAKICMYKGTLTDHFTGQRHSLPPISVTSYPRDQQQVVPNESLFDCQEGQVDFKIVNVFKGQKADMVIQRYLGSPSLLGRGCLVYAGHMDIDFSEIIDYGKSWSL